MRKKKPIAILLTAFILLPFLFSGGLQLFQVYLKHRAEQRIKTETLVDLRLPLDKVKWEEEGSEISVDGRMYDLESYSEENGFLIAKAVYDEDETRVMNFLNHFNNKEQNQFIIRLLILLQSILFLHILYCCQDFFSARKYTPGMFQFHSYNFINRIYHPPRSFSF